MEQEKASCPRVPFWGETRSLPCWRSPAGCPRAGQCGGGTVSSSPCPVPCLSPSAWAVRPRVLPGAAGWSFSFAPRELQRGLGPAPRCTAALVSVPIQPAIPPVVFCSQRALPGAPGWLRLNTVCLEHRVASCLHGWSSRRFRHPKCCGHLVPPSPCPPRVRMAAPTRPAPSCLALAWHPSPCSRSVPRPCLSQEHLPVFFFRPPISKDVSEVPSGQGDLFVSPPKSPTPMGESPGDPAGKGEEAAGSPHAFWGPETHPCSAPDPDGCCSVGDAGTAKTQKRCLQAAGELPPAAPALRGTGAKRPRPRPHPHPRVTCPC